MVRKTTLALICAFIGLALAACSGSQAAPTVVGGPALPGATALPTWTPPPLPTGINPTLSPTMHVPESLTTTEVEQRLSTLAPAGDCALPCYLDMIPGQGGLQEALDFYARLGISGLDLVPGDYQSALDGTGHLTASLIRASDIIDAAGKGYRPPKVDVYIEANTIRYVYVQWDGYPAAMPIQQVFQVHGAPDQLQLGLVLNRTPALYIIQALYNGKKTGFAYLGAATSDGSGLQVCVNNQSVVTTQLGVFSADQELMSGQSYQPYLIPVDQGLGLGIPDAVAALSSGCLTVPADKLAAWQAITPVP